MAVVVAIPTLNEAESIGEMVRRLPRPPVDRVIVADGGSQDGTQALARQAGAEVLDCGRGYGRGCLAAAQAAGEDDIVVFMDGDGADDPSAVSAMIRPLLDDTYDFVIGSRSRGRAAPGSLGWHQVAAGYAMGGLTRLIYGVGYTDMCAFRAIRRRTLLALRLRELTYGWNLEMQMRAAKAKLRILEIPVDNRPRIGGTSKVAGSLKGSVKAGTRILTTFARIASERAPDASAGKR